MQTIEVRVGAVGDPVLFPEFEQRIDANGDILAMGIIEKGTESGKTSVAFFVRTQTLDADLICCQMSSGMLLNLAAAVRGAVERFGS